MTPKNGRLHEINRAFVQACHLLGKGHAGGKTLTALLNLDKPRSKKAWAKHTRSIGHNTKNVGEIYLKKATLQAKTFLKGTGRITVDPLADKEKQNTEMALVLMVPGIHVAGLHRMG